MRLKLFRAAVMAEAMAQVRAELGAEALILNARPVAGGVEVTAALEPEIEPEPVPLEPARITALRLARWCRRDLHPALVHGDLADAIEACSHPSGLCRSPRTTRR